MPPDRTVSMHHFAPLHHDPSSQPPHHAPHHSPLTPPHPTPSPHHTHPPANVASLRPGGASLGAKGHPLLAVLAAFKMPSNLPSFFSPSLLPQGQLTPNMAHVVRPRRRGVPDREGRCQRHCALDAPPNSMREGAGAAAAARRCAALVVAWAAGEGVLRKVDRIRSGALLCGAA